ncbi:MULTISPECIES: GntR family transcriptional regulator [Providencia]|uniref:GntR family transcriptional regulator n=1 Tax=Providencia TaxID=586 RepID=UPI000F4638F4|nr:MULTISPECIES: GntR family transcriptional regulator [Providencia]MBG5931076.1 GntR family transcriptional regulator [Providencia rettgeri]MBS0860672.1 GntR family transcriptional regulator [Providencia rettgeri]MBS0874263.1 GntR family transcriptional regulator [Providencia rettgeri]MBS0921304.1 GntR family transcriptional regulator [Providencia rettgeri]MCG5370634.1 GntR family transcriptional regulator [Providencia rettgeri]
MNDAHLSLIQQLCTRLAEIDNTPLYVKFAETVKFAVRTGVLHQGDMLPSERELGQQTGVSRITVRKALELLEQEGVIIRSQGYGTQISDKFEYSLKEAKGFSQQVVLLGKKPNTLWVNKSIVPCSQEVAESLALPINSDVFMLKRIRYVDEQPVSIEESYVPIGLIGDVDDIGLSLYDYFRSQNIYPTRTKSKVSARMPDEDFQTHIKLEKTVPILVIKQVAFDHKNVPIEYSFNQCRSDMYVFVSEE